MTETDIKKEPLLRNLKLFYKYRTNIPLNIQHWKVLDLVKANRSLSIKEVCLSLGAKTKDGSPLIYDLIARGELEPVLELSEHSLSSGSIVRRRV